MCLEKHSHLIVFYWWDNVFKVVWFFFLISIFIRTEKKILQRSTGFECYARSAMTRCTWVTNCGILASGVLKKWAFMRLGDLLMQDATEVSYGKCRIRQIWKSLNVGLCCFDLEPYMPELLVQDGMLMKKHFGSHKSLCNWSRSSSFKEHGISVAFLWSYSSWCLNYTARINQ